MKVADLKPEANVAVIGDTGTGKTYLVGTLCQLFPTVVISADKAGLDTLVKMKVEAEIIVIADWRNVWDSFKEVEKLLKGSYRAVAVDDFGAVQEVLKRKTSMQPKGQNESSMRSDQRVEQFRRGLMQGDRRLQLRDFGEITSATEAFLYEFKQLKADFRMITLLEELREHPRTGEEYLYPDLVGASRYNVLAQFSLVVNSFKDYHNEQTSFCITSLPHPRIPTKDRLGVPRTWASPTAAKLLLHVAGKEGPQDVETEQERRIGTGLVKQP